MNISELVSDEKLLIWGEFSGVQVQVEYVPRERLQAMLRACEVVRWQRHQPVTEMDEERTAAAYAGLVHDWKITVGDLKRFFNVASGDDEKTVDCTRENKVFMLKKAYGFDMWLHSFVTEIQNFREQQAEEDLKN